MLGENGRIDFCDDLLQLADKFAAHVRGEDATYERALATIFALLVMRADLDAALNEIAKSELFGGDDPRELVSQAGMDMQSVSETTLASLRCVLATRGLLG